MSEQQNNEQHSCIYT